MNQFPDRDMSLCNFYVRRSFFYTNLKIFCLTATGHPAHGKKLGSHSHLTNSNILADRQLPFLYPLRMCDEIHKIRRSKRASLFLSLTTKGRVWFDKVLLWKRKVCCFFFLLFCFYQEITYTFKNYHKKVKQKNKEIPGREGQKKPGAYRLWPPLIWKYWNITLG